MMAAAPTASPILDLLVKMQVLRQEFVELTLEDK